MEGRYRMLQMFHKGKRVWVRKKGRITTDAKKTRRKNKDSVTATIKAISVQLED